MQPPEQAYRPDIDGLRAVAVLAVVAFHAFPSWVPGGYVGVDVFFVISGFLISGQLMAAASNGTFSLSDFYARRIRRIFPALIVVLAATAIVGRWVLLPSEWASLSRHIGASAIFSNNIVLWNEQGYFDGAAALKPLLHLWSLGVEEQFYLAWPLLIWWWWHRNVRWAAAIAITVIASFAVNVMLVDNGAASAAFYLPHARLWQLGTGALLAAILRDGPNRFAAPFAGVLYRTPADSNVRRINNAFSVIGVALIILTVIALDGGASAPNWWSGGAFLQVSVVVRWIARALWLDGASTAYPGWSALAPTLGAALVIAAGRHAVWNRSWLAARPIVFVGLISYPLYLWHWPILSFLEITEQGEVSRQLRAAAILIAFVLATVTYAMIERPIRRALTAAKPSRVIVLAVPMAAIGIAMLISIRTGWLTPAPGTATQVDTAVPIALNDALCRNRYPGLGEYCQQFDRTLPVRTALLGDSHAAHFFPGLGAILQTSGTNLVHLGQTGCPPLLNVERLNQRDDNNCARVNAAMLEAIGRDADVTDVWLSFRGAMAVNGNGFGDEGGPPTALFRSLGGNQINGAAIAQGLRETIPYLQSRGKHVGLLLQIPELGFRTDTCTGRPVSISHRPAKAPCGISAAAMQERQAAYRELIASLQREFGIRTYDPASSLCDGAFCSAVAEGHMLYYDDNHLGLFGSSWALRLFTRD